MSTTFAVKVRDFEGPLDLLLNLIEERKMLISDVSLSQVADDFLTFIESQTGFPLGQAAQFVLISATLLLLKSRALLPVLSLTKEEEQDIHDLELRLKLLQSFRGIAKTLPNGTRRMYIGGGAEITEPLFTPSKDLTLAHIEEAIDRVLKNAPREEKLPERVVQSVISLEEMIDRLSDRIQTALHMTFREFAGSAADKREMVVSFLAMLELVKRGAVAIEQQVSFGEIRMQYSGTVTAPRYE